MAALRLSLSPWPKQSYKRTSDLSKGYTGKFTAINRSVSTLLMFFVTSFLSVPASVQDMAMQVSGTAVAGYTLLLHVQLYKIYPVLIVVPVLVLAAVAHFLAKSGSGKQTSVSPDLLVDKNKGDAAHVDAHHIVAPSPVQGQRKAHVTRRASVAQGMAVARIAGQAVEADADWQHSLSSLSIDLEEDSLCSVSEGSEEIIGEEHELSPDSDSEESWDEDKDESEDELDYGLHDEVSSDLHELSAADDQFREDYNRYH